MKIYILAASLLFGSLNVAAGDKGNGGYSVVCRDQGGTISSAELLDIYEGRIIHQLSYPQAPLSLEALVAVAIHRTGHNQAFAAKFQKEIDTLKENTVFISSEHELELTHDALPVIKQKGCHFEQLANYTDEGQLIISQEIYDHLDGLNRAALLVHEAIYSIRRKSLGESVSTTSRKMTAHLMAQNAPQAVLDRLVNDSLHRPDLNKRSCGLRGSIEERIEDCSYQHKEELNMVLVTRTSDYKEVYKDLTTGLLWSDRLPSKVNLVVAQRLCLDSHLPELGFIKGPWRLPTAREYEEAGARLITVLPQMNFWFWTATTHKILADVFNGPTGRIEREYLSSKKTGSVRCVRK